MRPIFLFLLVGFSFSLSAQTVSEQVTLFSKIPNNDLKGEFVLPMKGKKFDLLLIQPGSGPTDRNGNSIAGVSANSYRLLAEELAKQHIATLLIDKRGIAASAKAMKKESDLRFDDYANDLADWVRFAKKDKRFRKIFIAGHSEGSLIGMLAAQQEKVNGYISIAGAGEPIDKILVWQYFQQSPKLSAVVDSMLTRLKSDQKLDSVPAYLFALFRPSIQPYIESWMKYDPCTEIKKLTVPVLILQGTTDIQVELKEAEYLHSCKPDAVYKTIEGMNHILKAAPADRTKNIATYTDTSLPLMPGLADIISSFIKMTNTGRLK